MRRFPVLLVLLAFAVTLVRAQSVHWEGSDDSSEVQLVFEDCTPDGDPRLPAIEDSSLSYTGTSSQMSLVNGAFSRTTTLNYNSRARRAGVTLQIPAFTVQTNKGPLRVPAFTGGAPRIIPDSTVNARLMTGETSVWAGEVFPLVYILDASRRSFNQLASNVDWNPAPLIVEDWSKPEPSEMSLNGEPRINIAYKTRAYAKQPGTVAINPATQLVRISTGSIGFGLFQQQRVEDLTVSTKRAELTVRPLPTPTVEGFTGAVGQFQLISKVVPSNAAVGEPVTWTLELSGSGNWPDIAGLPQREVSKDFQVVQPKAKRTPAEGKLFDATLAEDVVLVPTKPGTYTLGPITFTYFDPKTGNYQTLTTPRTTLQITAAAPASVGITLPAISPAAPATTSTPAAAAAPEIAAAPAAIPRDPLPSASLAFVPRAAAELAAWLAAPFAVLLLFWGWLALQRARLNDPARTRREARARLAATLAKLSQIAGSVSQPSAFNPQLQQQQRLLLLRWQHDSAVLWDVTHAAPPPAAMSDAEWTALWTESDRALYRADPGLPSDWVARAQAALAAKRVPGFSPFTALYPRNLLPFLTVLALAVLFIPAVRAEDGAAAYRRADFAAAERAWRAAVAQSPSDPSARYNLSLALAQQDHWDLAMAHATAALVQSPADEHIRWQFNLAAEKSGYLPAPLAAFGHPGPLQSLARLASPGEWQIALVIAAGLVALAVALLLFGAYRRASTLRSVLATLLFVASVLLATASALGFYAYGEAANARAVIVWHGSTLRSIPTDADANQKTTALAAGSVAIADKSFLKEKWTRLTFENGQTGWVRSEDVVALWR